MTESKAGAKARVESVMQVDVLVVGGGLAGLTVAAALAKPGVSVAVVERESPDAMLAAPFDGRSSAIAHGSYQVLKASGVWDHVEDFCPIDEIRVTDGDSPLFLHFDHREVGDEPMGFMVENRLMRRALLATVESNPGVTLFAPAEVASVEREIAGVSARLADGREIRARLAVGAEGRRSPLREQAGIRTSGWSYHQTGIVCTVRHERPHRNIAHERFLPAGPFAILPLSGNRSSIVWSEREGLADKMMALDDAAFHDELAARFGDFLGALEIVGPRWRYPLSLQIAERFTDRRLALVGDAAHGMHPIAGQGFNLGIRDIAAFAEVVVDAHRLGLDVGAPDVLARYQRWRNVDTMVLLSSTDLLTRLFSNDIAPVKLARDVGLAVFDKIKPLKRLAIRHAMGEVGTLPRLVRGLPL